MIPGDSLAILVELAGKLRSQLAETDGEVFFLASELEAILKGRLVAYEAALEGEKIALLYRKKAESGE